MKRLANWFEGPTAAEPIRFFLLPFHIPNNPHLRDIANFAGVVLDRARIVMIAEQNVAHAGFIDEETLVDYHLEARELFTPAVLQEANDDE